ncbi:MAG TPA: hypothetical protein VMU90_08320, partial [Solirubrobacteraceae bacterium]|nr:hypothetical protein [Solirubrobacteraceae bacterium]
MARDRGPLSAAGYRCGLNGGSVAFQREQLQGVRDALERVAAPRLELVESEHRQHAVVELAIRDLKDQALAHFPSGKFLANAAWTVIAALA